MATDRRARFWDTVRFTASVTSSGVGGTQILDIGAGMESRLGISSLNGFTIGRIRGSFTLFNNTADTSGARASFQQAIFVDSNLLDAADMPSLGVYDGNHLWYDSRYFNGAGTGLAPVLPTEASFDKFDSKAKRRIRKFNDTLFWIAQMDTAAVDIDIDGAVSVLWLQP